MLIDSSAWIDFLRRPRSDQHPVARELQLNTAATTDVVVLEVLSGTTDTARLQRWERLLSRCTFLEQLPRDDAEAAASLYRTCRRAGETLPSPNDCLVAAVAIRHDVTVLHRDRDFEVLARHTSVRVVSG